MKNFCYLFVLFLFVCYKANAQGLDDRQANEMRDAYQLFENKIFTKNIPDSTAILAFSFNVKVVKNKGGKAKVISIKSNDPIGYQVFPSYDELKVVDYSIFMDKKKIITFIFPVIIEVYSSKDSGKRTFISPLIHVLKLFNYPPGENKLLDISNYVYFKPYTIRVDKTIMH